MMRISTSRVQKHRAAMRAAGLRLVQIWVPDTRGEGFGEECRRQSLVVQGDHHEREVLDWLERVADIDSWKS